MSFRFTRAVIFPDPGAVAIAIADARARHEARLRGASASAATGAPIVCAAVGDLAASGALDRKTATDVLRQWFPNWPPDQLADAWTDALKRVPKGLRTSSGNLTPPPTGAAPAAANANGPSCVVAAQTVNNWKARLSSRPSRTGAVLENVVSNAITIFGNDDEWRNILSFDEFAQSVVFRSAPPWCLDDATMTVGPGPLTDVDVVRAQAWLSRRYGLMLLPNVVSDAITVVAHNHVSHPVREYLDALRWDNVPRVGLWLTTYLGVDPTPYSHLVGRMFLTSSVARIYRPGEKVDTMLILEGPQGTNKSSAIAALFSPWFSDTPLDLQTKDRFMALRGVWGYEIAELDSFSRSDASRVKAFVSSQQDKFRPPYGKLDVSVPRRCVFIGTVNPDGTYLVDTTGNRRFWPIKTGRIDLDALHRDRHQLWAEARLCFQHNQRWWPEGPEVDLFHGEQETRQARDEWSNIVNDYLTRQLPGAQVTLGSVLQDALKIEPGFWTDRDQKRAARAIRDAGWVRFRVRDRDALSWAYRKPNPVKGGP